MNVPQLRNFLTVAENLNFRKAAERILIAQPALSRQIQQLEEEVGAQLFDRLQKQIRLTPAGLFFKKEIERLLFQLDESVCQTASIHRGEAVEWRIGHASSAMQSVIPNLVRQINEAMPSVRTVLFEASNRAIFEKISRYELEMGFIPNGLAPAEIEQRTIYKEPFTLIFPLGHRIEKGLRIEDLANEKWILPVQLDSFGYVETIQRMLQRFGFLPNIAHRTSNAMSALRLVEAGLGLSIMGVSTLKGINLRIGNCTLEKETERLEMRAAWLRERATELRPLIDQLDRFLPFSV